MFYKKMKPIGRLILAGTGFLYDLIRFYRYGGLRENYLSDSVRNYFMVKVYHSLEKSMSFTQRRTGSGWGNATVLITALEKYNTKNLGFHDINAISILKRFSELELSNNPEKSRDLLKRLMILERRVESIKKQTTDVGAFEFTRKEFEKGILESPEDFFLSRYSLREFSEEKVSLGTLEKAIALAMKSPSVCNRQAWHIYSLEDDLAQKALSLQDGNRGFGGKLKNILIISSDLGAFVSPKERYQHWIDGGMFSMSMVWALHSLGIESCCLNWSQSPSRDLELRKSINIKPEHSIIMMIAIGYPCENNKVCCSPRRPASEVLTVL